MHYYYVKIKKDNSQLLQSPKTLILIGRYDKFSKYNIKNVSRYLEEKNQILTIPYNTLYMEATNEAGVPDLFLRLKRIAGSDDRNAIKSIFDNGIRFWKNGSEIGNYSLDNKP